MKNYKKGFTLAETMIVLVVLGLVAAITVPNVFRRYQESLARTKIKKSMSIYDYLIQKIAIENDIKSESALKQWANPDGQCTNSRSFFSIAEGEGCVFKTTDGIWWNLEDITNPIIALSKKDMDNYNRMKEIDGVGSFRLVTSFDSKTGTFRVNDLNYELSLIGAERDIDSIHDLERLYGEIEGKKNINLSCDEDDILCKYKRGDELPACGEQKKNCVDSLDISHEIYDENGDIIISYRSGPGEKTNFYKYDEEIHMPNGTYIKNGWFEDPNGNIFKGEEIIHNSDGTGRYTYYWWKNSDNNVIYKTSELIDLPGGETTLTYWEEDNNGEIHILH